jgi:hypothetical protein
MKIFCLYLFSTWIFIISILYPLHGISTFPLNIVALLGFYEMDFSESLFKNIYNGFLHLGPFLWIPYSFSDESLLFAAVLLLTYLLTLSALEINCYDVYNELVQQKHKTAEEFITARFIL